MSTTLEDPLVPSSALPGKAGPSAAAPARRDPWTRQPTDPLSEPEGTDPFEMIRPIKTVEFHEDKFGVVLWCTGTVRDVDREQGVFHADLVDDKGVRSTSEIDFDSVDPAERDFVVEGNRFTYVVFHEHRRSGLVNADEIVMEPLRTWTAEDVKRAESSGDDLSFLAADD